MLGLANQRGEFEAEAEQANQRDDFHERNYGLFTGYEAGFGDGHEWDIELSYDKTEFDGVESNWVDDLDSRVAIVKTAVEDLRGIARLSRDLGRGRIPLEPVRQAFGCRPGHRGGPTSPRVHPTRFQEPLGVQRRCLRPVGGSSH